MIKELKGKNCTGCEACVEVCAKKCIFMNKSEEGFYYPQIIYEDCVLCGKCSEVCYREIGRDKNGVKEVYAAYSKDESIRKESSSGGIFSELSNYILNNQGVVYGAAFNGNLCVEHIRIDSKDDLYRLRGSKYVQSRMNDSYMKVHRDLEDGRLVLFSGTPCQINGLYRFLNDHPSKLITCSVICHGVPSPYVLSRYIEYQQGRIGKKLKNIQFRNKEIEGWSHFYIKYCYDDFEESFGMNEDPYFKGFLENIYLRKSCYSCCGKWKSDEADIVLGDFWGIENTQIKINTYYGVSAVIVNSVNGLTLISNIKDKCIFHEADYEDVLRYNPAIEYSPNYNSKREIFFKNIKETNDIISSITDNLKWKPTKENKYIQLYPVLKKYFDKILRGCSLNNYFITQNKKNIVLYANTELMELCVKDIERYNDVKFFLSDMNIESLKKKYVSNAVLTKSEVIDKYKKRMIDCIIVCSLTNENVIINSFLNEGVGLNDIYSIVEYIYA